MLMNPEVQMDQNVAGVDQEKPGSSQEPETTSLYNYWLEKNKILKVTTKAIRFVTLNLNPLT